MNLKHFSLARVARTLGNISIHPNGMDDRARPIPTNRYLDVLGSYPNNRSRLSLSFEVLEP